MADWVSYAISYLFIAIVWVNHHHLLRFPDITTHRLIWGNFAHLFAVSLMPFATAWIASTRLGAVPVAFYAGDFFLVNVTYLLLCLEAVDRSAPHKVEPRARSIMRSFATLVIFAAAGVMALRYPIGGMAMICLCLILYLSPGGTGHATRQLKSREQAEEEIVSMIESKTAPTFILVHGAWADGSSWRKVIEALQAGGAKAVAAPIPLMSVADDVRALDRCLTRIEGPVILAAHAYAGAVISGTRNERVKGLVFVAALAPDEGETVGDVFGRGKPHPNAPQLAPDGDGFIWLPDSAFATAFAQNASPKENALFAAVQRPINGACLQEKAPKPLWKTLPSWYLLAEQDRMINPETQDFMAQRMKATLRRLDVDHTPIATAPDRVVELLREVGKSVSV